MSAVDYPIGSTVWCVLRVRSLAGLAQFYKAVLAWSLVELNGVHFFVSEGERVAEIVVDANLPDNQLGWLCFLGTDDLAEATSRAVANGCTVEVADSAIAAAGNASELIDPFGARFGLAQLDSGEFIAQGPGIGRLALVDPTNHDAVAQVRFQLALFPGDRADAVDEHITIMRNAEGLALRGSYGLDEELRAVIPPHWLPWFSVANQAESVEAAAANGGRVNTRDNDLPFARWGVVVDPQGGEFKTLQMTKPAI